MTQDSSASTYAPSSPTPVANAYIPIGGSGGLNFNFGAQKTGIALGQADDPTSGFVQHAQSLRE
jgi:hypothetical protein